MPPETYRYYRLGSDGHLDLAEWFTAANDKDASAQIAAKHPDAKCTVWRGSRLVAKLSPPRYSPDDASLKRAVGERLSALAHRRELGLEG